MAKVDMFCLRCKRLQRMKKSATYRFDGVKTAFAGTCPECGAWLFKMVRLPKTA